MIASHSGGEPMESQESDADRRLLVQQLFLRHERAIRAFAFGLTRDFPATDDVVQETFLTITSKASQFIPGTDFPAWACTIARLKVLECRRATRRFPGGLVESLALSFTPVQPEDDHLQAVLACLEKLPARARAIMQMRYLSEQAPAEIARQLNRSANGVRVALAKAREMLRACVGKRLGGSFRLDGGNA
jgi:RNA polymerase sigma-70 factor (ECF subfamily)